MKTFDLVPFSRDLSADWDAVASAADPPHFMFQRGFLDYHASRFDEISVIAYRGSTPVAIVPIARQGDAAVSHPGLTFGTIIAARPLGLAITLMLTEQLIAGLRDLGLRSWTIKPLPAMYHRGSPDDDICAIAITGGQIVRRDISTAIAPGARRPMAQERRRALRRGASEEYTVGPSGHIREYMALLESVLAERHDTRPVHTTNELALLMDRFPDQIQLVTAELYGRVEAGVVLFETPLVVHAQYIAASDIARRRGGLDVLMETLITSTGEAGKWFDFGISNERSGALNWGLLRNKEGFGGGAVAYDRYSIDLTSPMVTRRG